MNDTRELVLTLESHIPIITIESHDEQRVRHLFAEVAVHLNKPVFSWSMTEGMTRMDHGDSFSAQSHTKDPEAMLGQIKASTTPGVYVLMDFHPFIDEPLHTRLLKEIALNYHTISHTVVLVSHQLSVPNELKRLTASYEVALPTLDQLDRIVRDAANDWA
ncbi:MAG: ATPase, partial [Methylococcales bacterium]|nr:ATPase [Methylococcales bacterium]